MSWRASSLSGVFLAVVMPLWAQTPGTFEAVGFGRFSWFDDTLDLENKAGGGGMLGVYVVRNLALEAEGAYTAVNDGLGQDVSNIPIRGRLTYHIPLGGYASAIRLGAGYVRNLYRTDVDFDDDGITGLAGVRVGVSEHFAFQVDGTLDYVPSPDEDRVDHYTNWGVQAGLALLLGNSYDRDKDGVKDKADHCPATPAGESVNQNGCAASQRDTDVDGVKDDADRCANTAKGEQVDAQGCAPDQKDNDQDGLVDSLDKCRGTPSGEPVDQAGCSASQRDGDGDRVSDKADQCPATPAGQQVDANGCAAAERDSDHDSVMDDRDSCPNTASGVQVDANGCQVLPKEEALVLQGVNFKTGKAVLTPEGQDILLSVAQSLVANPEVRVEVQGHTDNTGTRAVNIRLSNARAEAVRNFLFEHGVAADRLTTKGYGPDQPVASNKTAAGRAENRRVALKQIP